MNVSAINCQACNASLNLELSRNGICNCEFCGTAHNLSRELTLKCDLNNHQFAVVLYHTLDRKLGLVDLQDLVYKFSGLNQIVHLRLDWENLPGASKSMKCMNLVDWCNRRCVLTDFVEFIAIEHPFIIVELL